MMCGVGFDPDDDISFIDAHHDTPRHRGGTDWIGNLQLQGLRMRSSELNYTV